MVAHKCHGKILQKQHNKNSHAKSLRKCEASQKYLHGKYFNKYHCKSFCKHHGKSLCKQRGKSSCKHRDKYSTNITATVSGNTKAKVYGTTAAKVYANTVANISTNITATVSGNTAAKVYGTTAANISTSRQQFLQTEAIRGGSVGNDGNDFGLSIFNVLQFPSFESPKGKVEVLRSVSMTIVLSVFYLWYEGFDYL